MADQNTFGVTGGVPDAAMFGISRQLIDVLRATGTPQGGDTIQRIGPLPNTRAALVRVGTTTQ